jgi:hypothetical protein
MTARKTAIAFVAALSLALPQAAVGAEAESVVPPENSAATQYTEALPTAGGDKQASGGKKPTPAKVLGAKNAKELESHGQAGREVARVAAETAPPTAEPAPEGASSDGDDDNRSSGTGSAKPGDGDSGGGAGQPKRPEAPAVQSPNASELPNGSSGLGEVLAAAGGSSSSGDLGALLPLAILAAIAWSLAFFWRQRRPAE